MRSSILRSVKCTFTTLGSRTLGRGRMSQFFRKLLTYASATSSTSNEASG